MISSVDDSGKRNTKIKDMKSYVHDNGNQQRDKLHSVNH